MSGRDRKQGWPVELQIGELVGIHPDARGDDAFTIGLVASVSGEWVGIVRLDFAGRFDGFRLYNRSSFGSIGRNSRYLSTFKLVSATEKLEPWPLGTSAELPEVLDFLRRSCLAGSILVEDTWIKGRILKFDGDSLTIEVYAELLPGEELVLPLHLIKRVDFLGPDLALLDALLRQPNARTPSDRPSTQRLSTDLDTPRYLGRCRDAREVLKLITDQRYDFGQVEAVSEDWVVVRRLDTMGRFDGFAVLETNGLSITSGGRKHAALAQAMTGHTQPEWLGLPADMDAILEHLANNTIVCGFGEDSDDYRRGVIVAKTKNRVLLDTYERLLFKERALLTMDEVRDIEFLGTRQFLLTQILAVETHP